MNRSIHLERHLPQDAIEEIYRKAKEGVAKGHWQIIWLLSREKTTQEIADVTGYSARWVRNLVRRYNQQGPEVLGDRRHENPGGLCCKNTARNIMGKRPFFLLDVGCHSK